MAAAIEAGGSLFGFRSRPKFITFAAPAPEIVRGARWPAKGILNLVFRLYGLFLLVRSRGDGGWLYSRPGRDGAFSVARQLVVKSGR